MLEIPPAGMSYYFGYVSIGWVCVREPKPVFSCSLTVSVFRTVVTVLKMPPFV